MNKHQLVDAVGERVGDRRTAAVAVDAVLDTVTAALAGGDRVALFGFGVFEVVDRAARTARNPATGATVQVPATSVPRFRAGQALKAAVGGGTRTAGERAERAGGTAEDAGAEDGKGKPAKAKSAKAKDGKGKDAKAKDVKAKGGKGKGGKDGKGKDGKDGKGRSGAS